MTVSSTINKISYVAGPSNATTAWTFPFPGVSAGDIVLYSMDASGNITTIATNLYSVTLNAAVSPNPTGIGGTVNYPLTGSPVINVTLTIMRVLPLTQGTSLSNQSTLYPNVIEEEFDNEVMQLQQVNELLGRQLTVAVSDPNPTALPSVALRANQYLGFDSSGNPTALVAPSGSTPVSSAMAPVVNAATLAAARTALGLGAIATEGIGTGLADDGAGNVHVVYDIHTDTTNQSVTAAFHMDERHANGTITYTFPASSTLFNAFGLFIYALGGSVTLSLNAADAFDGMGLGVSISIPQGKYVFISTDGSGTWFTRGISHIGFNAPVNYQIQASVAANALTILLKDEHGNDASVTSPVFAHFRDTTAALGDLSTLAVTTALSIVVPSSATLGTTSNVASRIWLLLFNNAGSPVLGVINCSTATAIYPLLESIVQSPAAISAGSTAAGTYYAGSALTNKAFRILGYIESTQVTAGTWASSPTRIQVFGPGQKKPGDVVQTVTNSTTTSGTTASATFAALATGQSLSITPTSAANLIRAFAQGTMGASANSVTFVQLQRGSTLIGNPVGHDTGAATASTVPASILAYDVPNTTSSTAYSFQGKTSAGTLSYPAANSGAILELQEIMG